LTLTFDDRRDGVTVDGALWFVKRLVQTLNEEVGGRSYRDKWGHSYFGYVVGVERHKSGVPHVHVVVDNWVDFKRVHVFWNKHCGFAWTTIIKEGEELAKLKYVVKYVVKVDQAPGIWLQRKRQVVARYRVDVSDPALPSGAPAAPGETVKAGVHSAAPGDAFEGVGLDSEQELPGFEKVGPATLRER
jgi:hypothetical protein